MALAMAVDLFFGEPPESIHPTVWMGRVSSAIERRLRTARPAWERLQGVAMGAAVVLASSGVAFFFLRAVALYLGVLAYVVAAALLLKTTLAVKSMGRFTTPIAEAAGDGDYAKARELLRDVVRRETDQLSEQQVLSAAVETIAEGTVDGVTGPVFLYALLGVPGAVAYRAINTLDSTVGYTDRAHLHIGWFSARLDTLVNYVPARLTALLTVVSSRILSLDWSNCVRVLVRDHGRTASLNAGWSMSAMAGALGVSLEKPGAYVLGEPSRALVPQDISRALKIMRLNVLLFAVLVCVPLMAVAGALVPIA